MLFRSLALRQRIVYEQERSTKSMEKTESLTQEREEMAEESERRKREIREKVTDMTTHYKAMEKRLTGEITEREKEVAKQEQRIKELKSDIEKAIE